MDGGVLYLEHGETIHPGDKTGKGRFSSAGDTDQKQVALRLTEDSIDPKNMIENLVEKNQRQHVSVRLSSRRIRNE